MENWFLLVEEDVQLIALVELETLLVNGPLHFIHDLRDDLEGVLETNREAA